MCYTGIQMKVLFNRENKLKTSQMKQGEIFLFKGGGSWS